MPYGTETNGQVFQRDKMVHRGRPAGYIENWKYHKTYSGTPQDGILSPILANIYLNELDKKIEEIKQNFEKELIKIYFRDTLKLGRVE